MSILAVIFGILSGCFLAVLVGIIVFDEASTLTVWCGVALVCLSVALVMLGPQWLARRKAPDGDPSP